MEDFETSQELTILSYLVQHPEILKLWGHRIRDQAFISLEAKVIFSLVRSEVNKSDRSPTPTELKMLVNAANKHLKMDPDTYSGCLQWSDLVHQTETTDATGTVLSEWITAKELQSMGSELLTIEPHRAMEKLSDFRAQIDKLQCMKSNAIDLGIPLFAPETIENFDTLEELSLGPPIPTGYPRWDIALRGGIRMGEFMLLGGTTGSGKSMLLFNILLNVVLYGFRVVYIALDNMQGEMMQRFRSRITQWHLDSDLSPTKSQWENEKALMRAWGGPQDLSDMFWLKVADPKTFSPEDLESYIRAVRAVCRKTDIERGIPPESAGHVSVCGLDYLDQMADPPKVSARHEQQLVLSEKIASICRRLMVATISPFQINREGFNMATPTLKNMSSSIGKGNIASHIYIWCQTPDEAIRGESRLVNFKSRRVSKFYVNPMSINLATQTVEEDPNRAWSYITDDDTAEKKTKASSEARAVREANKALTSPYSPTEGVANNPLLAGYMNLKG